MAYGTITQVATGPGGSAGDPIDCREGNGLLRRVVNVVGDGAYVAGGRGLTAAQLGFPNSVLHGQAEVQDSTGANATSAVAAVQPQADGSIKLKCFTNANVEIAGATNVSGVTWQLILWGF
ncbi:MAG: hypothetical protein ACXVHB_05945 [Solirubrobacteraceae bacterium]